MICRNFINLQVIRKSYKFASDKEKEIVLSKNFDRINNEIEYMLNQLLGLKINGKRDPRKKEVDE